MFAPPFLYGELDAVANGWEEPEVLPHWPHPTIENAAEHPGDGDLNSFTERELDVLKLLGAGLPNKLIAHRLSLREGTVKVHVRNVMRKLRVTSRTQAALVAVRHFTPEAQS